MKYRTKEVNGFFYPQFKYMGIWHYMKELDKSGYPAKISFTSLKASEDLIRDIIHTNEVIIHPFNQ